MFLPLPLTALSRKYKSIPCPAPSPSLTISRWKRLAVLSGLASSLAFAQPERTIEVPAGQFLDLRVHQEQGDVAVALVLPSGAEYAVVDRTEYRGVELLPYIAVEGGPHRVVVRSKTIPSLRYRIDAEVRPPSETDRARAEGFRLGWIETKPLGTSRDATAARKRAALWQQAADAFRRAGDARLEAYALTTQAEQLFYMAQYKPALELCLRALPLQRGLPDEPATLGSTILSVATLHTAIGDVRSALRYAEEALAVLPADGAGGLRGQAVTAIGNHHGLLGDNDKALEYKLRGLAMRREAGDRQGEGSSLAGLATFYYNLRNLQKAIEYAAAALAVFEELKDEFWQARAASTLGMIYAELREPAKALGYLNRCAALYRRMGNASLLGDALYGIAGVHRREGDYVQARKYFEEAAALGRSSGRKPTEARALAGLCDLLTATREWDQARTVAEQALALGREMASPLDQIRPLRCLGQAAIMTGRLDEAGKPLEEGLALARRMSDRGEEMRILGELARLEGRRKNLVASLAYMEQAAAIAEADALRLPSPEMRSRYRTSRHSIHEGHLEILMALHAADPGAGYGERAFAVAERFRARGLAELIGAGESAPLSREDRRREAELLGKVTAAQRELFRSEVAAGRRAGLHAALAAAERELDLFQSVAYAGRQAEPAFEAWDAERARRDLAGADGAVVAYSLGGQKSYVWAVTAAGVTTAELPGRKAIEERVQTFRKLVARPVNALTGARALTAIEAEGKALFEMLVAPVAGAIEGKARLLIVPDGTLAYLPFEAIGLQDRYRVAYTPSASTAGALRARGRGRTTAPKALFAMADPALEGAGAAAAERGFEFTALPHARAEVGAIGRLFPAGASRVLTGAEAAEDRLKREDLAAYRYLHFAAHGYFDEAEPGRSGLVLARGGEDGFLQAREVARLKLSSDLVTLSACQSGLGRLLAGEGVQGLARAFLHAGSQAVVVSLWNVNDEATAELMRRFYGQLRKGLARDEALREAKRSLAAPGGRWRHPYYWAGFVLQGE